MDFTEQDVDVFDEEYDGAEAEAEGGGGASSGSSSPSSSSSSSAAASSSSKATSSGRSNSPASGGGDGDGGEYNSFDIVPVKPAAGDEEEEEVRDLFGSDNEDVKAPGHSNFLISGPPLVTELATRFSWAKLSPQYFVNRIS